MANNVNNGTTGVIDIPGALRSRGAADGNLVGGVVAYAGDIYDVSESKNQAAINSEVSSAIDNILSNLFSGDYDDLENKPTLSSVATSGSINDITEGLFSTTESTSWAKLLMAASQYKSTKPWSVAIGNGNMLYGPNTFCLGYGLKSELGVAVGRYNTSSDNVVFTLGFGTADDNRKNAITVDVHGNVYLYGVNGYTGGYISSISGSLPHSLTSFVNNIDTRVTTLENSSSSSSPITASGGGYVLGNTSIAYSGSFAEGYQNYAYGAYSHVEGSNNSTANGTASHAEGSGTKCNGGANHAEGYITKSYGTASHSEGYNTTALNDYSHAEGNNTVAIAEAAHSEGIQTIAYGKASHAEGYGGNNLEAGSTNVIEVSEGPGGLCQLKTSTRLQVGDILMIDWTINPNNTTLRLKVLEILEEASDYTLVKVDAPVSQISDIPADYEAYTVLSSCKAAYGTYSHVEGYKTTASGDYSHAEGEGTETTNTAEHASGKYNQSTPNVTLFSVGIGADGENRANAFEVDVNGNIYIQDIGNYDGTNIGQNGVKSVQLIITELTLQIAALTNNL